MGGEFDSISRVETAEAKAKRIIEEAQEHSAGIIYDAEVQAKEMVEQAKSDAKMNRDSATRRKEGALEGKQEKKMKSAEKNTKMIAETKIGKGELERLAQRVVDLIIGE